MGSKPLQINRYGSFKNIETRLVFLTNYDFSKLSYQELVYDVIFSSADTDQSADILQLDYWYKDLHDSLEYLNDQTLIPQAKCRSLINKVEQKLDAVHQQFVSAAPEEWPEYKYLLPGVKDDKSSNWSRKPAPSAQYLYGEIEKLVKKNKSLEIANLWRQIERFNDVSFEQLEDKFSKVTDQKLRMQSIREHLLFGCIEVSNLNNEKDMKKSAALFRYIYDDGGFEDLIELTRGTIAKRLNRIKKDFA